MIHEDRRTKSRWLQSIKIHAMYVGELEREKALAVEQLNRIKHCSVRGRDRELLQTHRDGIRKIEHDIETHRKATREILEAVQSIKKPQLSEVIRRHYIEGKPLDVIAEEMNYSTANVWRLHTAALDALQLPEGYGDGRKMKK